MADIDRPARAGSCCHTSRGRLDHVRALLDLGVVEARARSSILCSAAAGPVRRQRGIVPVRDGPVQRHHRGSRQLALRCLSGPADLLPGGTSHRQHPRRSLGPLGGGVHRGVAAQPRVVGAGRRFAPVPRAGGVVPQTTLPYRLRGGARREDRQGPRMRNAPSDGMVVRLLAHEAKQSTELRVIDAIEPEDPNHLCGVEVRGPALSLSRWLRGLSGCPSRHIASENYY